jgi:HK97 family phage prohead protease
MDQIVIPDFERVMSKKNAALRVRGFMADDAPENKCPAIEGFAIAYNRPFEHKGELVVFIPGSFSESLGDGTEKFLCVDHDKDVPYASTKAGLHVEEAEDGVVFHVQARHTRNPVGLMGMVESKNRRRVSVSCDFVVDQDSEVRRIAGHNVRLITKAKLTEISLVKQGKSEDAFAFVTDSSKHDKPTAKARSLDFTVSQAIYRMELATDKVDEQTNTLIDKLDAVEEHISDDAFTQPLAGIEDDRVQRQRYLYF